MLGSQPMNRPSIKAITTPLTKGSKFVIDEFYSWSDEFHECQYNINPNK